MEIKGAMPVSVHMQGTGGGGVQIHSVSLTYILYTVRGIGGYTLLEGPFKNSQYPSDIDKEV